MYSIDYIYISKILSCRTCVAIILRTWSEINTLISFVDIACMHAKLSKK